MRRLVRFSVAPCAPLDLAPSRLHLRIARFRVAPVAAALLSVTYIMRAFLQIEKKESGHFIRRPMFLESSKFGCFSKLRGAWYSIF